MVQITSALLATIVMASQALAITCVPGQFYCGYYLLSGPDNAAWKDKIDAALIDSGKPVNSDWEFKSLFTCFSGNTIKWDDYCPSSGLSCSNPGTNTCGPVNYCCAKL